MEISYRGESSQRLFEEAWGRGRQSKATRSKPRRMGVGLDLTGSPRGGSGGIGLFQGPAARGMLPWELGRHLSRLESP